MILNLNIFKVPVIEHDSNSYSDHQYETNNNALVNQLLLVNQTPKRISYFAVSGTKIVTSSILATQYAVQTKCSFPGYSDILNIHAKIKNHYKAQTDKWQRINDRGGFFNAI